MSALLFLRQSFTVLLGCQKYHHSNLALPVAGIMLTVHVAVPAASRPLSPQRGLLHADIGWLTIIGIAISIPRRDCWLHCSENNQ